MKGTLELRRRFRGLGEVRVASGTRNPKLLTKMDAMLLTLADAGRFDVLRAILQRRLTPMEVWEQYRTQQLDRLPSPGALKRLVPAWTKWAAKLKASEGHRRDVTMYGRRLFPLAGKNPTAKELPRALRAYRAVCERDEKAVSFNRCRAAVQAFLRDTMTRNDEVYREAAAIETLPVGPRTVLGGQSPEAAAKLARALPRQSGITWLLMCATGMGPGELEGRWHDRGEAGLEIHGTKRESRHRTIPRLVEEMPRARVAAATLRKHLRKVAKGVTPYDGRRTFAHWMEGAGISRARRKAYLGHSATDVTDLYEAHEVAGFLPEDRDRLLTYARTALNTLTDLLTDGDTVGTGVSR